MNQSLSLKNSDGTTVVGYSLRSSMGTTAEYMDPTTSPAEPRVLKVSHAMKAVGSKGSDRHTVLTQRVLIDALGVPQTVSVSTTVTVPRSPVVTALIVKDEVAHNQAYLALPGAVDAILDGITP